MRGSAVRALVAAGAVLALVGLVAVAATGSTDPGSGATRPPADALLDTILSLGILLLIPAAVILIYGLLQRRAIAEEMASGRYRRTGVLAYLAFFVVLTAVAYFRLSGMDLRLQPEQNEPIAPGQAPPLDTTPGADNERIYEPDFAWLPVLVVVALASVAAGAYYLSNRRRKSPLAEDDEAREAFAAALDETLDDLRAEPDPRRAIIAAYARFERVLGAHGLPRGPSEAPEEYLGRALRRLDVDARSARRLTDLFEVAKFSQHHVDLGMKEEAIDALEQVRDELRAAAVAAADAPAPAALTEGHA